MLINPGSELTFASGQLIKTLQIPRRHASIPIIGIRGSQSERTRGVVPLTLHSIYSSQSVNVTAYILKNLTSLPSMATAEYSWPHLHELQLADPDFLTPGPIDLILGADSYGLFIQPDIIKRYEEEPIAQRTIFGWIVLGPTSAPTASVHSSHHVAVDHELHDLLTKFWIQKEVPAFSTTQLNPDEEECETQFKATLSRDRAGRYVVRLALKLQASQLGESRSTAQRCLQRTLRRLSTDPIYQNLYSSFILEYEELQHMIRVPPSSPELSPVFYLPHHGVLKDDSITTKLRVVFNGSSLTSTGSSLNDILPTGAKLQPDISDILLWVRRHRYIFITDITKMFRQIQVHPDNWDLQRILWVDDQLNIIPYQLTTGRYVDDICGGADTLPELTSIAHQLVNLCKAGGFPLAKWQSNHPELLQALPMDVTAVEPNSFDNTQGKILGLIWQPHSDQFVFSSKAFNRPVITKQIILSEVAQLFDPLGFLSPVIIRAKTLLQELWLEKVGWDDCLSPQLRHRWTHFRSELSDLTSITIPLWMSLTPSAMVELHGFSDASQLAMAAAVYIKVIPHTTEPIITLVCAKTKVAPLKRLTISRLELMAAVLLSRLISYVQRTLELAEIPIYLWTDSSHSLLNIGQAWYQPDSAATLEERPGLLLTSSTVKQHHLWELLYRYSSLIRLLQITAQCQRCCAILKGIPQFSLATPLTPADLEGSYWIRSVQSAYFSSELTIISSGAHLTRSHPLAKFTAFIDHSGILRVGGRFRHSQLDPEYTSLKRLFNAGSKEFSELAQLLTHDGTTWVFNPPAAPHFGGKWEAAVKSVKHHLRRTIGETALTYKKLTTLLVQIEAILNSRPLCPLSDDPEDLAALTPGHFIIGAAPTTIPEPSLSSVPLTRVSRWQLIQQQFQHFWSRWSVECLQRQLAISKWHHPSTQIKVGSLVLLTDERFSPSKWPLARVTRLHLSSDGLCRVVTLKTAITELKRPITKLAVLPMTQDQPSPTEQSATDPASPSPISLS
ncbi:uncharacterized protein LOC115245421 [Formica exsecta]|uniref:uncharacterized protein LOC115245421 n=1 Tax=Formica exsecta TaxID=72781 RepID=UPI0011443441|nr:uncharacterized protein LOC115245421 [Formica exsecta]